MNEQLITKAISQILGFCPEINFYTEDTDGTFCFATNSFANKIPFPLFQTLCITGKYYASSNYGVIFQTWNYLDLGSNKCQICNFSINNKTLSYTIMGSSIVYKITEA